MRRAIAVLLGMALLGAAAPESAGPAPAGRLKIGYVDLTRVLRQYHKRQDLEQELRKLQESFTQEDRSKVSELQKYRQEAEQLAAGSPERKALEEKQRQATADLDQFRRASLANLNQRFVSMIDQLYGDIEREVEALGRERDFDLILKDQSRERPPRTRDEAVLQIAQRIVLYSRSDYDLTDLVAERLNARYDAIREQASQAEPKQAAEGQQEK